MALLTSQLATIGGDRTAITDDVGTLSWAELDEQVNRLVHALRDRGLVEGDTVALMSGNQREAAVVTVACLHGGWLVVPVNWHWVAEELAYVLDDADAAALIVAEPWADVADAALRLAADQGSSPSTVICIGHDDRLVAHGAESLDAVLAAASPDEPADQVRGGPMFYTSGTTGFPKGVKGVLGQTGGDVAIWQLLIPSIASTIGIEGGLLAPEPSEPPPVLLLCGPIYHSAQWVFAFAALLNGAAVVMQHRFDAAAVLDAIDAHAVTNLHLVPAQMSRLLHLPEQTRSAFDGSSLRCVQHGAAPCPEPVKRAMLDWWGPVLWEYYGGTEGGFLTMISPEEWLERPTSVGRPVSIMEVEVRGPDGAPLPPGEVGDLCFRSILGTSFEYHKAPDKTAAAHRDGGSATLGDLGWVDEDGFVFLSDRRTDLIISGGVNIYPAEIERVLNAHAEVDDVAVFGIPDDEMGQKVMAVIQPAGGLPVPEGLIDELDAHCREHLAGYKRPRRWDFLAELPRSEAGKLTKRALRDPYWEPAGA